MSDFNNLTEADHQTTKALWHEAKGTVRLQAIRIRALEQDVTDVAKINVDLMKRNRALEAAAEKVHGIIAEYWGPCMGSVECLLTLREAIGERASTWRPKVSDLPRVTELETSSQTKGGK